MSDDTDNVPQPVTDEMNEFTNALVKHLGHQFNAFVGWRGIDKTKSPLQETLMALGTLVSNAIVQQPEASRPRWLHYFINGVTSGTGVSFLIAHLPPEMEAKINEGQKKETLN